MTNNSVSEQELARLARLESQATAAPWEVSRESRANQKVTIGAPNGDGRLGYSIWDEMIACWGAHEQKDEGERAAKANAELIVAVRNTLPGLLAEIAERDAVIHDLLQDSQAYIAGHREGLRLARWMIAKSIKEWKELPTAERLKAGPVRGLERLLETLPQESPAPRMPPDVIRNENERLRGLLRQVEWSAVSASNDAMCPYCGHFRSYGRHDDTCELAAALK